MLPLSPSFVLVIILLKLVNVKSNEGQAACSDLPLGNKVGLQVIICCMLLCYCRILFVLCYLPTDTKRPTAGGHPCGEATNLERPCRTLLQ